MLSFAAKLDQDENIVWLSTAASVVEMETKLRLANYRTGGKAAVLENYIEEFSSNQTKFLSTYQALMESKLTRQGFYIVRSINACNKYRLYVLYVDDPVNRQLYVGQTSHEIEIRFLQHKNDGMSDKGNIMSARMFRSGQHKAHSIAYDLILDNKTYSTKATAEHAEAALGKKLRAMGYKVHWA